MPCWRTNGLRFFGIGLNRNWHTASEYGTSIFMTNTFPIDEILPEICSTLARNSTLVIQAPPGAGKTTQVPPALLNAPWLGRQKILMLEPRRVAARAAAGYMASRMGESVGGRVGYQIRMERKISADTRIEVVTEGILTARLQSDPSMENIGVVIFDEFHERNLNSDLGLALCLEIQEVLRDDLKLVIMSATLDLEPVAALLDNAPILISKGKSWPVTTHYVDVAPFAGPSGRYVTGHLRETRALEAACVWAIKEALSREHGDILVFIPGMREIKNMEKRIRTELSDILTPTMELLPLHGSLPRRDQDKAILTHPHGHRKIVLATAIAETSITMEGVNIVIDMGLMRISRFYPGRGMDRLETVTAPLSSVDQRRGRAGRTGPGVCYRLWSRESHDHRTPFPAPEIIQADLADLVLQLALWGVREPSALKWLDLPPDSTFNQARDLLIRLGALDKTFTITSHGKKLAHLGIHPRLGHMVCRGKAIGHGLLACHMAALLQDRDIINFSRGTGDADITLRLEILYACKQTPEKNGMRINTRAVDQVRRTARQLAFRAGIRKKNLYDKRVDLAVAGTLLSFAFPERIAMARPGQRGVFIMASGAGARVNPRDVLAGQPFIVAAQLDGQGNNAMVFLGAAHDGMQVEKDFPEDIVEQKIITWDPNTKSVKTRRERRYGALLLSTSVLKKPDASRVAMAMLEGIRSEGLCLLPWTKPLKTWQARVCFLASTGNYPDLPPVNDAFLLDSLESWLLPFLDGISSVSALKHLDLTTILESRFTWSQRQCIKDHAPTHITVPSGSRIPLVYGEAGTSTSPAQNAIVTQEVHKNKSPVFEKQRSEEHLIQGKINTMDTPVLPVRLQEMFGCTDTPTIAGGTVPVVLHLLSPAGRPVQITRDLKSFWNNTYVDVKKDLMGRYPRHYWPDNPLNAQPTRRAKPKARAGKKESGHA